MTTLAVTSVNSHFCHASSCLRIGSKLRCMGSTPTAMQSISENDFECLASTGMNTLGTRFPDSGSVNIREYRCPRNGLPGEPSPPLLNFRLARHPLSRFPKVAPRNPQQYQANGAG